MNTTNQSNHKELLKQFYEAFNAGNVNEFDRFMTEDIVEHSPDPAFQTDKKGREYVKEVCLAYKKAFPDLKIAPQHIVEEGDKMIAHLKITGTNTGELFGIPPTNKKVDIEGFDMLCLNGDIATDHWGVFDTYAMLNQLGLAGEPGGAEAVNNGSTNKAVNV